MANFKPHRSSIGSVAANLMSVLAYVLAVSFGWVGFVAVIIIISVEQHSGFVKFNASQALIFSAVFKILSMISSISKGRSLFGFRKLFFNFEWFGNFTGGMFSLGISILTLVVFVCMVVCAVRSYKWAQWKVPFIGDLAEKLAACGQAPLYNGGDSVPPECEIIVGANNGSNNSCDPNNGGNNSENSGENNNNSGNNNDNDFKA